MTLPNMGMGGLGDLPPDYGWFKPGGPSQPYASSSESYVRPWFFFGSATITAGTTSIFVQTNTLAGDFEGLLLGFDFYLSSEDYQTSPVSIVLTSANGTSGASYFDPLTGPVSRDGSMFFFPSPWGIPFRRDQSIGLQTKNNEAASIYAEGRICGISWPFGRRPKGVEAMFSPSGG